MSAVVERPIDPTTGLGVFRKSKKSVKLVSCIVRSDKLDVVTSSLNKLNLVGGMTVTDVRGIGRDRGEPELYRGPKFIVSYVERVKIELVIDADDLNEVQKMASELARTGDVGDGKIFILDVHDLMRIRTQKRGISAL